VHDVYVATCQQLLVNNVANNLGGSTISKSYYDIIKMQGDTKPETRTSEEIYLNIKRKLEEMR